jgi:hypothetical protein
MSVDPSVSIRTALLRCCAQLAIAVVLLFSCGSASSAESIVKSDARAFGWGPVSRGLSLGIAMESHSYSLGSAVPVRIAIRNTGPTISIFRVAIAQLYDIDIKDQSGRSLARHSSPNHGFSGSFRSHWTIPAGQQYETDFTNLGWYFDFDNAGLYKLTFSTRIFLNPEATAPYATLKSGSISFDVVK